MSLKIHCYCKPAMCHTLLFTQSSLAISAYANFLGKNAKGNAFNMIQQNSKIQRQRPKEKNE